MSAYSEEFSPYIARYVTLNLFIKKFKVRAILLRPAILSFVKRLTLSFVEGVTFCGLPDLIL